VTRPVPALRDALRSRTLSRTLAVVLALAAAVCLTIWSDRSTPADRGPAVVVPSGGPAVGSGGGTSAVPQPRPVRLAIPVLGVATNLTRLGLQPDGTVQVPKDPAVAGWYRLGPPPGSHGPAVILGHVDSVEGPGVFSRLAELDRGARIRVRLDDGATAVFLVHSVRTYANADFPARRVYGGHGRRELNLVTCGGAYDDARGGYQANVVVNARWVAGAQS
jgi:hypothetical protein